MSNVNFEEKLGFWEMSFKDVLPAGYRSRTIDQMPESEERQIMSQYDDGEDQFGFVLMGKAGVGKTYALTALMNKVLEDCHKYDVRLSDFVAYYPVGYLLFKLRSHRDPPEFDTCVNTKFLFLDDLGAENTTDFAREHFFTIIDLRCQKKFPTFITTNLTFNELKEKYGERVVSRLKEMCLPLSIKGDDRRTDMMKERMLELKNRAKSLKLVGGEK